MRIEIVAEDGKKFVGTDYEALIKECNAHEANMKLLKAKEEAERKAREEKENELKDYREKELSGITEDFTNALDRIKAYEKKTELKVFFGVDYSTGKLVAKDTRNTIDFGWSDVATDLIRAIFPKAV